MTYSEGDAFTGGWSQGKKQGNGVLNYKNGDRFRGVWESDHVFGVGTLFYANGDRYDGEWIDDQRHGTLNLTTSLVKNILEQWFLLTRAYVHRLRRFLFRSKSGVL
jgi:hypothetical protein